MDVESIRSYCLSFPQATENLQWGDDLCFKIGGKIFLTLGLDHRRMCFKCVPEKFAELVEQEDIRPAPYVGRYKWVMLDRLDALGDDELRELIRESYEMIAAKAAKLTGKSKRHKKAGKKPPHARKRSRVKKARG